jgi:hypothetical protein
LISETDPFDDGQALAIPRIGGAGFYPVKGWTIWTFTDLDWLIMQGLPVQARHARCHLEDLEEGQRLLADCRVDGI